MWCRSGIRIRIPSTVTTMNATGIRWLVIKLIMPYFEAVRVALTGNALHLVEQWG